MSNLKFEQSLINYELQNYEFEEKEREKQNQLNSIEITMVKILKYYKRNGEKMIYKI